MGAHPIVAIMDRCFSRYLPASKFDTPAARVALAAISGQEAKLVHRWQVVDLKRPDAMGPARGLWQCEQGTRASRGGVWGAYLHPASAPWLRAACAAAGVEFEPVAIYRALHQNDAFACAVARLLLYTDAQALPAVGDEAGMWAYYLRVWRPGAYSRGTAAKRAALRAEWSGHYATALRINQGDQ